MRRWQKVVGWCVVLGVIGAFVLVAELGGNTSYGPNGETIPVAVEKRCDRIGLYPTNGLNAHGGATGIEECEEHEAGYERVARLVVARHIRCNSSLNGAEVRRDCEADEGR